MSVVDWFSPVLSFVGGGLGSALGYRSAAKSDGQADRQSRREEWGRRFTTALDRFTSPDETTRSVGRAMMAHLLDSDLVSTDDRLLARRMLVVDASGAPEVRRILAGGEDGRDVDFAQGSVPDEEDQ